MIQNMVEHMSGVGSMREAYAQAVADEQEVAFKSSCEKTLIHGKSILDHRGLNANVKKTLYKDIAADLAEKKIITYHARIFLLGRVDAGSILSSLPRELIFKITSLQLDLPFPIYNIFKAKFIKEEQSPLNTMVSRLGASTFNPPKQKETPCLIC